MIWWLVACFSTHPVNPVISAAPLDPTAPAPTYVGSAICGACHASANEVWARSEHATALATLTTAQHGADPECLACHVTGFRLPGGWAGKTTPELDNVGCEACHGPGSDHAAGRAGTGDRPFEGGGATAGTGARPYGSAANGTCVTCHTRDNSPDFVESDYWRPLEHGR